MKINTWFWAFPWLVVLGMAAAVNAEMAGMEGMPGMEHESHGVGAATAPGLNAFSHGGSGTSWLPEDAPLSAVMGSWEGWHWMAHGNLFLRYDTQNPGNPGRRGSARGWDAPNWAMAMAERQTGEDALLVFKLMLSLDPLTIGGQGYPLLFQSGESWQGQALVDRQHPHDLFSELAVLWQQQLGDGWLTFLYLGYPGEPALGPPAFMHRVSAASLPDSPLGHHWQDSAHVTFGVGTFGLAYRHVKVEGSVFKGREPDENRYNFDPLRLDSFSGRLSYNPFSQLALQTSYGFLHSPEALHPEESIHRFTASAVHQLVLGGRKDLATSLVWGVNHGADGTSEHSLLLESALRLSAWQPYFRAELVEKSREELELDPDLFSRELFQAKTAVIGASCEVGQVAGLALAVGGQVEFFFLPKVLEPVYGPNPYAVELYLRIYPGLD